MQMIARVRQRLGVDVTIAELFARPVLAEFAARLQNTAQAKLPPIFSCDRSERVPLSFAQQRLWFLAQMEGGSEAYHISFSLRFGGELDGVALRRALDRIVFRHEALRTTFVLLNDEPVHRITSEQDSGFFLLEHDLRLHGDAASECDRLVAEG